MRCQLSAASEEGGGEREEGRGRTVNVKIGAAQYMSSERLWNRYGLTGAVGAWEVRAGTTTMTLDFLGGIANGGGDGKEGQNER